MALLLLMSVLSCHSGLYSLRIRWAVTFLMGIVQTEVTGCSNSHLPKNNLSQSSGFAEAERVYYVKF